MWTILASRILPGWTELRCARIPIIAVVLRMMILAKAALPRRDLGLL